MERRGGGDPLTLTQADIALTGHAIECRLNAEDPTQGFRPSPGLITRFEAPEAWRYQLMGPVRLDTHVREGYRVPTLYDSMLGKLIVHAPTRDEAIEALRSALRELHIEGVPTTAPLHEALLNSAEFRSGDYSTPSMSEVMIAFAQAHNTQSTHSTQRTGGEHG